MSDPTQKAPETESEAKPDVLLVPAAYFFVERVEVPPAVTPGELADYAELSMEGLAPFPLEQLRWGFLIEPEGRNILLYAALNERLKREGYTDLESYTWVLPDFAALQGARFAEPVEIELDHGAQSTRITHPGGEGLPTEVDSYPSDATSKTSTGKILRLRPLPIELTDKGLPIFQFETLTDHPAEGYWSPLTPDEANLWLADIRPAGYKSVERSARRTSALIGRLLGYAAVFALLLILLEGLFFGGQFWLGTQQAKVEAQSTAVRRVEDKQSLLNKLEQVAQNELRPIAILEAANNIRIGLGKTGIEYDEVVIEGVNRLTIEGKANTINELNAYTEALRKSGNFELVETPKQLTRSGKTTFTATLDYTHREPPPEEATEPEASETSEPATSEAAG